MVHIAIQRLALMEVGAPDLITVGFAGTCGLDS